MGVEILALAFDSGIIKISALLLQNHSNLQLCFIKIQIL